MEIGQEVNWRNISPFGDARLVPLKLPSSPPPPFDRGFWRVGWGDIDNGRDRLSLAWTGVSKPSTSAIKLVVYGKKDGAILWQVAEGEKQAADLFPTSEIGSLQSGWLSTPSLVIFKISVDDSAATPTLLAPEKVGGHFAALMARPSDRNVTLSFPRCGQELWTREALLRQSPYFDTLLSSGFAETSANGTKERLDAGDAATFEDSDDETDAVLPKPDPSTFSFSGVRTISINDTAYSTYLAVICWMQCGFIAFSPLTSSFSPSSSSTGGVTPAKRRLDAVLPPSADTGPFPPPSPVSPKSVYRLSHLLELPTLSSLALSHFRSQLTSANVAYELFSPTSCCYEAVLDACIDFVLKNVKEVFESEGMKEFEEKAARGEMDGQEGAVWAKLAGRVARGK